MWERRRWGMQYFFNSLSNFVPIHPILIFSKGLEAICYHSYSTSLNNKSLIKLPPLSHIHYSKWPWTRFGLISLPCSTSCVVLDDPSVGWGHASWVPSDRQWMPMGLIWLLLGWSSSEHRSSWMVTSLMEVCVCTCMCVCVCACMCVCVCMCMSYDNNNFYTTLAMIWDRGC